MTAPPPVKPLAASLKRLEHQEPHILSLRFPNFRNLAPNAELRFASPITVLLGRNGTNKSSILHALYGAPRGNTIAEFWFETELDAIPETNDEVIKQSVVHRYRDKSKQLVECIKARAPRNEHDPDYWEAVKPTTAYGFAAGAKRISPIDLEVLHLDFRGQLPAFDKYFHFPDESHLKRRMEHARKRAVLRRDYRKQDYLRRRTRKLKEALDSKGTPLTPVELQVLGYVLERDYDSGVMLEHSLFRGHRGHTILFHSSRIGPKYSEAFAGSGESAATILIHSIEQAKPESLVLLDEPETSLHPRAQQRILEFLADRAAAKNLQVVIATHSYYLTKDLPAKSIRTLTEDSETGRIVVDETMSPSEALHEIITLPPGKVVLVEDERAKCIVLAELRQQGGHASRDVQVVVRSGGASRIYEDIRAHSLTRKRDLFVVFDGDQRPKSPIPDGAALPQGLPELTRLITQLTAGNDTKGPDLKLADSAEATRYIEFLRSNVRYLPGVTPESLVWNEDAACKLFAPVLIPAHALKEKDFKKRLTLLADKKPAYDDNSVFVALLSAFLEGNSPERLQLRAIVEWVRQA